MKGFSNCRLTAGKNTTAGVAICASLAISLLFAGNLHASSVLFIGHGVAEPMLLQAADGPGYRRTQFSDGSLLFVDRADRRQRVMVACGTDCVVTEGTLDGAGGIPAASQLAVKKLLAGFDPLVSSDPEASSLIAAAVEPEVSPPAIVRAAPSFLPPLRLVLQLRPDQDLDDLRRALPNS